ncbi:MAG: hypothetical protein OXC07_04110 [Kistimonas sp.]|nr:hypothetical protein [Kistimonas sp.]
MKEKLYERQYSAHSRPRRNDREEMTNQDEAVEAAVAKAGITGGGTTKQGKAEQAAVQLVLPPSRNDGDTRMNNEGEAVKTAAQGGFPPSQE